MSDHVPLSNCMLAVIVDVIAADIDLDFRNSLMGDQIQYQLVSEQTGQT